MLQITLYASLLDSLLIHQSIGLKIHPTSFVDGLPQFLVVLFQHIFRHNLQVHHTVLYYYIFSHW